MSGSSLTPEIVLEERQGALPRPWLRRSATAVAGTHFAISMFILFGALLVGAGIVPIWLHVPVAAWGVWVHVAGWTCPLTPLEKWLRRLAGDEAYDGGFVERYILPKRFRGRVTEAGHVIVGLLVLTVNLAIYAAIFLLRG